MPVDYDFIARQHGGRPVESAEEDLDALAAEAGGSEQDEGGFGSGIMKGLASTFTPHLPALFPSFRPTEKEETGAMVGSTAPFLAAGGAGAVGAARGLMAGRLAAGTVAKRAAVGAALGAGAEHIPILGSGDTMKGATFGALIGAGAGGSGALWRHGRKKALIKRMLDRFGGEAAEKRSPRIPVGASSTPLRPTEAPTIPNVRVQAGAPPAAAPPASAPGSAPAAAAGPVAGSVTLPQQLTQEQIRLLTQARGLVQNNPENKVKVVQWLQQNYPDSWREMFKWVMAPRTKPATIYTPGGK